MSINDLSAGALCTRLVAVAYRSMAVDESARLMRQSHVGCVVVVEDVAGERAVVGILTDRDIVTTVVARDAAPSTLRVADVMTDDVVCVREEDSLADAVATMQRCHVRRVPVVGARQKLVGIITADDVLQFHAGQLTSLSRALTEQIKVEALVRP
ncbi:MAG: CBS domain-containing protein [Rubrivivax sp.]|jgi:CBS domain-containing protein